jgi:hypothetical protein
LWLLFFGSGQYPENKKASRLPERNLKAFRITPSLILLSCEGVVTTFAVHTDEREKKRLLALPLFQQPSHPAVAGQWPILAERVSRVQRDRNTAARPRLILTDFRTLFTKQSFLKELRAVLVSASGNVNKESRFLVFLELLSGRPFVAAPDTARIRVLPDAATTRSAYSLFVEEVFMC